VQVGDIVRLTPEPWRDASRLGIVVARENPVILHVVWASHDGELERVNQNYLEVISAAG
jgi:hypothetical protein